MEQEQIQNLLFSSTFRGITMFRVNYGGKRAYVTTDPFKVYSGLTGAMEAATFKGDQDSKRIEKWRQAQIEQFASVEKHGAHMDSMASFGTALHEAIVNIWNDKKFKFDDEKASHYFIESDKKHGIPHSKKTVQMRVYEYHKAICSLMQFVYDEVSEIIAIETMACSNEYKIATPLDVVYRDKKGVLCNVNIKTSSQIGNHHRNQVSFEKYMWNLTYPEMQIEKTGIIRPKDWKIDKVPTYELEFVKDDAERVASLCEKFGCVLRDPDASYDAFRRETRVFTGEIELGGKPQIAIKTLQEAFEESMETI